MFDFSDFDPVSLRWVIILSIGGVILFIILVTALYCWMKKKRAKRILAENNRRENYRPTRTTRETRQSMILAERSTSEQRNSQRSPRNYWSQNEVRPSAPPSYEDGPSAPPSYEEAQLDLYIRKLT